MAKAIPVESGIIFPGDLRETLPVLRKGHVQTIVTSPPYFGLRDYGTPPLIWGGEVSCNHVWGGEIPGSNRGGSGTPTDKSGFGEGYGRACKRGRFCERCSAWEGSLGLEPNIDMYVKHIVEVFRIARDVLHDTGTLWLNLGDSYASSPEKAGLADIKVKDLFMVPFRVALALQADGWFLRSTIPWIKGNGLPESVRDRPGSAVEYWFMFSKSKRYFYDIDAIRIPNSKPPRRRNSRPADKTKRSGQSSQSWSTEARDVKDRDGHPEGRNRRNSDWFFASAEVLRDELNEMLFEAPHSYVDDGEIKAFYVNPEPLRKSHFATFPTKLIDPMIKTATSEGGGCSQCFSPMKRGEEGWGPTCRCDGFKAMPQIVLDFFGGTGTVGVVAESHGRRWRLCELKDEFIDIAKERITLHCRKLEGLSEEDALSDQQSLFF